MSSAGNIYVEIRGRVDKLEADLQKAKQASAEGAKKIEESMKRAETAGMANARSLESSFVRVKNDDSSDRGCYCVSCCCMVFGCFYTSSRHMEIDRGQTQTCY